MATTALTNQNVPGTIGFAGLTNVLQATTHGGSDLEPPDQGLCAGGGYVMEFINNALAIYNKNGYQLVAPIGSADAFLQPTTSFFSDPRCYYDAPTKRWFYQEFTVGGINSVGQGHPERPVRSGEQHAGPHRQLQHLLVGHHRPRAAPLPVLR